MRKWLYLSCFVLIWLYLGCNNSKKKVDFELRNVSDMSQVMRIIVQTHQGWKKELDQGNLVKDYPTEIITMLSATLTDGYYRDSRFDEIANKYLVTIDELSREKDLGRAKILYTNSVRLCMDCHTDYCKGMNDSLNRFLLDSEE